MILYSKTLRRLVKKFPGKRFFGVYRFLPVFFIIGAALEFSMINWRVGEVNFYNTYKKKKVEEIVEQKLHESV
ncbi:small integral membrane protein 4 [Diachasmimorpha longicaudata]|uniref:small integral membrane protein 4 n=1 Tax=Diachasmimorpha longicaudata TaxID=58733 RepID=UPI0030B8EBA1